MKMTCQIPEILTDRLLLRPFRKDDAPHIRLLAGDPDVARMTRTIPNPYPERAARQWLDNTWRLIAQGVLHQHAITKKNDSTLMGCLTLRKRAATENEAELSYWMGKPYWGCGYIPEAAHAALSNATETFKLTSARAAVLPENQRSIRVLEKLGFILNGSVVTQGPNWEGNVKLSTYVLKLDMDAYP